ncbi:protein-arginine deiminase family protein [Myxococcus xanthus]|uniref:protein-arginine deiminase family protein n=1 Tax=Myxococcus xanthus TaxID=34 RepID=UPI0011622DD8|nr:protein-arginine deiminase family protein [Myxococcus xanthus]QDE86275.1 hypothetical protein BHS07_34700 [Myxococcus xanthus]QDF08233.1 hypothetical protein BHS04_34230 [Myxococcus xanthus]
MLKRKLAQANFDTGNGKVTKQRVESLCNVRPVPTQLTVRVTELHSFLLLQGVTIYVTNGDGSRIYQPNNGQSIAVAPDTYTVRAHADWHVPFVATAAGVVVAAQAHAQVPLHLEHLKFHLHVDADRDGVVDADHTGLANWQYGNHGGRKGAILLCNNDDDDAANQCDHADQRVNIHNDHQEVAPLEIRRDGANFDPSAQWAAQLSLLNGRHQFARVFGARATGANEVIGPTQGDHFNLPDLNFASKTLGIEALAYANGAGFDGLVMARLTVWSPRPNATLTGPAPGGQGVTYTEDVQFRVAPWMIASHLVPAERLYAVDLGQGPYSLQTQFLSTLDACATNAGIPLDTAPGNTVGDDIWMQDCMELGQHHSPHASFQVVNCAPRRRGLETFPGTLLAPDIGYVRPALPGNSTTYDSTGNLEVTPPIQGHDGVHYPFGRIYYCRGDFHDSIDADFERFLQAQVVQAPLLVDSSFFTVGHVDELISFVPAANGSQGFKLLIASPRRAYNILHTLRGPGQADWPLLHRRVDRHNASVEIRLQDFRLLDVEDPTSAMNPHVRLMRYNLGVIAGFTSVQDSIDRVLAQLIGPLGLAIPAGHALIEHARAAGCADATLLAAEAASAHNGGACDVIEVPVIFEPGENDPTKADAKTVNMVNMVVVNGRCIVPMAFGPTNPHTDVDEFEEALRADLTACGLAVEWINTWYYHLRKGGVHCGSNTLRQTAPFNWWLYPNA